MTENFLTTVSNNKPIFFHLLDGFINKDIGNTKENTFNFIQETVNPLCKNKDIVIGCNINAHTKLADGTLISHDEWLEFLNLKTNTKTFVHLNPNTGEIAISENSNKENVKTITVDRYNKFEEVSSQLLELFKFNIFQLGDEVHATSLLTFIKDNSIYLNIVNSGDGIDKYTGCREINGVECYSPHFSYLICDDIGNISKLVSTFKSIVGLYYFQTVYYDLTNLMSHCVIDDEDKYCVFHSEYNKTVQLLRFIIDNCDGVADIEFGNTPLKELLNKNPTTLFKIHPSDKEFITNYNINSNSTKLKYDYVIFDNLMTFSKTLYKIFCSVFVNKNVKLTVNNEMAIEIKNNVDEIYKTSSINKIVLDKIIFHIVDSEIYIIPQEGGSCTWYSMYWPMLMYHIYYKPSSIEYKNFIEDINRIFKTILEKIFSKESFTSVFPTNISNLWLIYYDKFANIGFLNKEKLDIFIENILEDQSSYNTSYVISSRTETIFLGFNISIGFSISNPCPVIGL